MNRWRRLGIRTLALLPVFAVLSSPVMAPHTASMAAENVRIAPELQRSLSEMSTGEDQELVLEGMDAQSRNSRIPTVSGMLSSLSAYSPIALGTQQHAVALKCLTQAVYYEAANEPNMGKRAVAQVVLNRMRHPAYPNSVCGVVYEGVNRRVCQFSFTCDGALLRKPLQRQWSESLQVAKEAIAGKQLPEVGTATHYHADYVVPKWAFTLAKLDVIGRHIFYRFPGSAGEPRAFRANWARSERIPQINWGRIELALAESNGDAEFELEPLEDTWTPGLTVAPAKTDRHALNDVGGRIDTTKEWRLTIPDPTEMEGSYRSTLAEQGEVMEEAAEPVEAAQIAPTQEPAQ